MSFEKPIRLLREGEGSISYGAPFKSGGGGGGITVAGARNGLSVDAMNYIVLGQDLGAPGNPGALISDREISMQGMGLDFIQSPTLNMKIENGASINNQLTFTNQAQNVSTPIRINTNQGLNATGTQPYGNFFLHLDQSVDGGGGQFDCVLTLGYNSDGTGGRVNPNEAAFSTVLESHFVNAGEPDFEYYLTTQSIDGHNDRQLFLVVDKVSGYSNMTYTLDSINYKQSAGQGGVQYGMQTPAGLTLIGLPGSSLSFAMDGGNAATDGAFAIAIAGGGDGAVEVATTGGGTLESFQFRSPAMSFSTTGLAVLGTSFASFQINNTDTRAGSVGVSMAHNGTLYWQSWNADGGYINQNPTFIGNIGLAQPDAYLELASSDGAIGHGPLKFNPGNLLTTPPTGLFEFDSVTLTFFVTRSTPTRETLWMGNAGAAAPALTATPAFTHYYGGNTNALGDPNSWAAIDIAGTVYKIPLYT